MAPPAGRGRGGAAPLTTRPGHNRYLWDYRWANNGPLVAPGKYRRDADAAGRSAAPTPPASVDFEVQVDPACWRTA